LGGERVAAVAFERFVIVQRGAIACCTCSRGTKNEPNDV
jgi:hypothetical protein